MKTQTSFNELIQNIEKEIFGESAEVAVSMIKTVLNTSNWSYVEFMIELNKCAVKATANKSMKHIYTICHFQI